MLICYTSSILKTCPNLKSTAQLAYTVTDVHCDCGRYFNVFITFPNISMTYPLVLVLIMALYSHQHGVCSQPIVAKIPSANCVFYIRKQYNKFICIIDRRSLYRMEHTILNTHQKYLPIDLQSSATKFSLLLIANNGLQ